MIRVLQIVDSMQQGGIQSFLMNLYRNINRNEIQFDFLIFRNNLQWYEKEIDSLGGILYKAPGRRDGLIKCSKYLDNFFKSHKEYDVVHYNASSLSFVEPLRYAKKYGVKTRIIHCHSSSFIGNPIHRILHKIHKRNIASLANVYLSCSEPATLWMFRNTSVQSKVQIILNGVDCKKFAYSDEKRKLYRNKLCIENNFVVGHIGRFSAVKNHLFLIEIFEAIKEKNDNAKLLLVGDGEMRSEIESLVALKRLTNYVIFLGNRNDINDIMQAMDILVMPSLYEGFPVTVVEAQASGLPVVMSNTITSKVVVNKNVVLKDLNDNNVEWAKTILKKYKRVKNIDDIIKRGFDIKNTVDILTKIYSNN